MAPVRGRSFRTTLVYNGLLDFEVVSPIQNVETVAVGVAIRENARLRKVYGRGRWRKLKGTATIRFSDGTVTLAEVHWYEAHGIGRKEIKIKRLLEQS